MSGADRSRRIATLNDQLRARVGLPCLNGRGAPRGLAVITRGIVELPPGNIAAICSRVRAFSEFDEHNDPYGEHDFGAFGVLGVGKVYWKIDVYADETCQWGAEHPDDPERSFRVITIMLAEEY
jgi:hypothetical protein